MVLKEGLDARLTSRLLDVRNGKGGCEQCVLGRLWGASLCNPTYHYCIAVKVCIDLICNSCSKFCVRSAADARGRVTGRRGCVVNWGVLYCAACRAIVRRLVRLVFGSAKAVETRRGARNKVGMVRWWARPFAIEF